MGPVVPVEGMSVAVIETQTARSDVWLRGLAFDLSFILGIASLAIASGLAVAANPALFVPILIADLWLLGYHHVIATYTRLCFDAQSLRAHRFLVTGLPVLVLAVVLVLGLGIGLWALVSVYFYWQWFHYTRQSWGISQAYRRKSGALGAENERLAKITFYVIPLWGILHRSVQDPDSFLGVTFKVIPVPGVLEQAVAGAAALMFVWWVVTRIIMWREGQLPLSHTLYMLSHFAIFYIGYVLIEDVNAGWLVVNIWHNAQYITFVWHFNNNRFRSGIDAKARLISWMSQTRNVWAYILISLLISTAVYIAIANLAAAIVTPIIVYQAINFHHYVVDGLIWKLRRKPLRQTLNIQP